MGPKVTSFPVVHLLNETAVLDVTIPRLGVSGEQLKNQFIVASNVVFGSGALNSPAMQYVVHEDIYRPLD